METAPKRSPWLTVDPDRLGDEIAEMASQIDAATHRLLTAIRQFDEARAWSVQGARDCAHWLSWRIGLGMGAAREKVRVARALGRLPLIDAEFRKGALSYAKVRAITRIATPDIERMLVHMARAATGAKLERICRGYRSVDPDPAPWRDDDERRSVRKHLLEDGRVRLEITLEADEAAVVTKAIDAAVATLRAESDVSAETRPSKADGIKLVAETYLEKGPAQAASRPEIMIHLEQDALGPDGRLAATLEDGTHVSAETLRRVACDAGLVVALLDETRNPLDVGRKTRSIPPAIRRALVIRDRTCRFPGCSRQACLHGHHVQSWLEGGDTKLSNLVLLCPFHHWLVHEGDFRVAAIADGVMEFRTPKGAIIPAVGPPKESPNGPDDLRTANAAAGLEIDAMTSYMIGDGRGTVADAVGALCDWASHCRQRGQRPLNA